MSNARIFGGVNGNFGTGAMGAAQDTGKREDTKGIAELYLNNMGAVYTEGYWGKQKPENPEGDTASALKILGIIIAGAILAMIIGNIRKKKKITL